MSNEDKKLIKKALVFTFILALALFIFIKITESEVSAWENHTVQYGDTLWDIAREHNPDYNGDIREVMYCIKKANNMETSTVYVGYVLEVPVMEVN